MSAAFGSISGELRQEARACLARARDLLSKNELAATRYACLELRLAIESFAYQQLDSYLNEIPDDAIRKWTPREVIAQMLEVDPKADKSSTMAIGREEEHGQPSKDITVLGEDRRFTLKWANRSHNALGNFLHVPTLHQTESRLVSLANGDAHRRSSALRHFWPLGATQKQAQQNSRSLKT